MNKIIRRITPGDVFLQKLSEMKPEQIEHIGIAVKSLKEARYFYEEILGLHCYKTETVAEQKVTTAFYKIGEVKIELLESTSPDGPVGKFIAKRGEGIHHIAYKVSDIKKSLEGLKEKGIRIIDEQPRPGADNMMIAFLHPLSSGGVLTEICQPADPDKH